MTKLKYGRKTKGWKLYQAWANMKRRCNNIHHNNYQYWGGKGISYAKGWENFEGFLKDMGNSYNEGLSLERIDGNKNYTKDNCIWATRLEQANNLSNNRKLKYKGVTKTLSEWSRYLKIKRSTLAQRYYVYKWTISKCFSKKVNGGDLVGK